MALPSRPFGDEKANRRLIDGHNDDLAFDRLDILGLRQPNAHDGAHSNRARQMDIPAMPLDNVLADSHP